ncbi:MAG: hypothetical protein IJ583_07940 [Firmicutes bacterium]|nr:hypothetical protein [Bacillota bacterium]
MRYFFYLAVLAVMLSVTGCSNKTGSLTGKINKTADSIRNDGTNALNRITDDTKDDTNNYDNKKDITKKEYHNDLFAGEYYSQESTDTGTDSKGYESINGISEYVGDAEERISADTAGRGSNYVPPYGYGMVGAENIIGNDKKPKRSTADR